MIEIVLSTDGLASHRRYSMSDDPLVDVPRMVDAAISRTVFDIGATRHVVRIDLTEEQARELVAHLTANLAETAE